MVLDRDGAVGRYGGRAGQSARPNPVLEDARGEMSGAGTRDKDTCAPRAMGRARTAAAARGTRTPSPLRPAGSTSQPAPELRETGPVPAGTRRAARHGARGRDRDDTSRLARTKRGRRSSRVPFAVVHGI